MHLGPPQGLSQRLHRRRQLRPLRHHPLHNDSKPRKCPVFPWQPSQRHPFHLALRFKRHPNHPKPRHPKWLPYPRQLPIYPSLLTSRTIHYLPFRPLQHILRQQDSLRSLRSNRLVVMARSRTAGQLELLQLANRLAMQRKKKKPGASPSSAGSSASGSSAPAPPDQIEQPQQHQQPSRPAN